MLALDYVKAMQARAPAIAAFCEAVFTKVDLVHGPVVSFRTPTIVETDISTGEAAAQMLGRFVRLTRPISYLGLPVVAANAGFTRDGMPIGMQLIAAPFDEATALAPGTLSSARPTGTCARRARICATTDTATSAGCLPALKGPTGQTSADASSPRARSRARNFAALVSEPIKPRKEKSPRRSTRSTISRSSRWLCVITVERIAQRLIHHPGRLFLDHHPGCASS